MRNKQGYWLVVEKSTGKNHVGTIEGNAFQPIIQSAKIPLSELDLTEAFECSQQDADTFEADAKQINFLRGNMGSLDKMKQEALKIAQKIDLCGELSAEELAKLAELKKEALEILQKISSNH